LSEHRRLAAILVADVVGETLWHVCLGSKGDLITLQSHVWSTLNNGHLQSPASGPLSSAIGMIFGQRTGTVTSAASFGSISDIANCTSDVGSRPWAVITSRRPLVEPCCARERLPRRSESLRHTLHDPVDRSRNVFGKALGRARPPTDDVDRQ